MIQGVSIVPLLQITDERGKVMHVLKSTDNHFIEFGEIYFSTVFPGAIKGWHIHSKMTINYAVPIGRVKLVLYDDRNGSPTQGQIQEIFIGPDNYVLVTVPPMVWNGFKGVGLVESLVANCASIPHDPTEITRLDPFDKSIPYDWTLKHR
jgi:dTDP-4-dehydrorhamnose 3,5-epimerase